MADQNEYINKVCINYDFYTGDDRYSDGAVENTLLELVKSGRNLQKELLREASWAVLYHLTDLRENIVNWIPMKKTDTVLEAGAGCGAVTGAFLERCGRVVSVELSKKRSLINAYRHKDADNLEIMVGRLADMQTFFSERFDIITLIGVLEYAGLYQEEEDAYGALLRQLSRLLKPDGRLVIAIENRLGLKYFAGCREDHLGSYFTGIENDYAKHGVRTFSRKEMITLLQRNGLDHFQFYYPYPDYKLPEVIYSDEYLPKRGELTQNITNFDADRYVLFDETKAWDGILEAGLFPEFSNSFLIIAESRTMEGCA